MVWLVAQGALALLWFVKSVLSTVLALAGLGLAGVVAYVASSKGGDSSSGGEKEVAREGASSDTLEEARRIMRKYEDR